MKRKQPGNRLSLKDQTLAAERLMAKARKRGKPITRTKAMADVAKAQRDRGKRVSKRGKK